MVILGGGPVLEAIGTGAFSGGITWISIVATGCPFLGIGWAFRKKAKEAAWLRKNGISCTGIVRGHSATGTQINGVPMVRVQIDVTHPQIPGYSASVDQLLSGELQSILQPGTQVALRVHPKQPVKIMLELS
jgi:hypothetical protein